MKRAILFFWLACVVSWAHGQNYHPLVESGKTWSTRYVVEQTWIYSDFKKFEGDTSLNGFTYRKILTTRDTSLSGWTLRGYIRETPARQVFYLSGAAFPETMIYDFSMQPGDSALFWGDQSNYFRLDSITVTTLLTGEHRSMYNLSARLFNCTDHWIEGAGSLFGVLEPASCFWVGGTSDLLCFTENDTLKFHDPAYSGCYVITGIPEENAGEIFSVFQNRQSGKLVVTAKGAGNKNIFLDLVDIFGQIVLTSPVTAEKAEINLDGLTLRTGLYLARIRSGGESLFNSKIMLVKE